MSYPDANNPFASPQAPVAWAQPNLPPKPIDSLEYFRMYTYVFDNPNWTMTILWGFLCIFSTVLIPVVGQLVFLGYQFMVIDALLATNGSRYPDFDLNRFGDYLGRSIWPFLVKLLASLLLIPVVLIVIGIPVGIMIAIAANAGHDAEPIVFLIGIPLIVLLFLAISVLFAMVLVPMSFRAGMAGSLGEGFNFAWVKDYLRRVWFELFLSLLFLVISAMVLTLCGLVLCYFPAFAAGALVMLAEAHLMYQVYSLYLSRGGEPIPARVISQPAPLPQPMKPPGPPTF